MGEADLAARSAGALGLAQWPCIKPGRLRPAIGTWAPGKTASAEHCCVVG